MATGFFHHIGTFLLLAATVLMIVTCISAPVVNDIALLKVELSSRFASSRPNVAFGTFGYCINNVDGNGYDDCSPASVGYNAAEVMRIVDNTEFSDYAEDTARSLTKAMILHPIACGLNFIAFLLALGAGFVGSLLASLVALLAFIASGVAVIIDFVLFSIIRSNVNDNASGATAYYGAAAWTTLVSAICSLIGTIVVFLTCCSGRLRKRRERRAPVVKEGYGEPVPVRRRRWF
ncbi:hypothetical protein OQA88_3389 [Cercophora sp. LCS_1]